MRSEFKSAYYSRIWKEQNAYGSHATERQAIPQSKATVAFPFRYISGRPHAYEYTQLQLQVQKIRILSFRWWPSETSWAALVAYTVRVEGIGNSEFGWRDQMREPCQIRLPAQSIRLVKWELMSNQIAGSVYQSWSRSKLKHSSHTVWRSSLASLGQNSDAELDRLECIQSCFGLTAGMFLPWAAFSLIHTTRLSDGIQSCVYGKRWPIKKLPNSWWVESTLIRQFPWLLCFRLFVSTSLKELLQVRTQRRLTFHLRVIESKARDISCSLNISHNVNDVTLSYLTRISWWKVKYHRQTLKSLPIDKTLS